MQFSTLFAAAALNSIVAAVQLTNTVYNDITAGKPYSIGWSNATGPVTLTLKNGPALQLKTVSVITTGATTSPYTWDVPANLPADTYAIEISDGSPAPASPNYGPQFQLLGATASASASTASSTGSATGSTTASSGVSTSTTLVGTTTAANSTSSTATGASNSTASATGSSSGTGASNSASKTTAAGGSKTSAAASSSSSVPATNSATEFASPLALVFLTFAAIFTLN